MRAVLIDPFAESVTEVEYTGDYRNIYEHIKVDCFDCAYLDRGRVAVFVDDMGLLRPPEEQRLFLLAGYHQPLSGRGLVLGIRGDDNCACPWTAEQVRARVTFLPNAVCDGQLTTIGEETHPIFGKVSTITNTPVFKKRR